MSRQAEVSLTVQKALRVIREFSIDGPTLGIAELARRLDLPRSTTSRLVAALCTDGYVRRTAAGTYALGLRFVDYGSLAVSSNAMRALARSEMLELRQAVGLSTHLSFFDRTLGAVVHIDRLRAGQLERFPISPADRVPVHATSSGKAHLAFCDGAEIEHFTARALERFTAATFVSQQRIARELDVVRGTGYAVGRDEFIAGVSSVAAPIFGSDGKVVAAISLTGLSHELTERVQRQATTRLCGAVGRLSAQLRAV